MKKISSFLISVMLITLLASCSKIYIDHEDTLELNVGESHQLNINTNDELGLTFESSDETVVLVSDDGLITALKAGVTTISVYSKTKNDISLNIEVTVIEIEPTGEETIPSEPTGEETIPSDPVYITELVLEIEKTYVIDDIPYQNYRLVLEDEIIISIDETTITALEIGEVVITVINTDDESESYEITVTVIEKLPVVVIEGEQNSKGIYTTEVTISISIDDPTKRIQYKLFTGVPPMEWETYRNPIEIKAKGAYGILYRVINRYGDENPSEQQRLNLVLDFIMDETYTDIIRYGQAITYTDGQKVTLPIYQEKENEVRGIWVSTVSNIDLRQYSSDESYKAELIKILDTIETYNLNTVFFQIRSMNDAFYPSEYAPYSRYIKGVEGAGLDWDIFEFVINEAHERNLEVHAWLNPYRVSSGGSKDNSKPDKASQLNALHDDNFAKQNPNLVLADEFNNLILNPGSPEVRQYLRNVVSEILENYNVDGIHFDDYFYIDTTEDDYMYSATGQAFSSKADWRRNNVDLMIQEIGNLVRTHNNQKQDYVKFGISPAGIWANKSITIPEGSPTSGYASYGNPLYADTRKWVLEEWIDYIIPQVYWDFDNVLAPHADIVKWWAELIEDNDVDVALIIGQGLYQFRNGNFKDYNAIVEQIRYASKYDAIKGITFFTFRDLLESNSHTKLTLERIKDSYWTGPVDWPWASHLLESEISGEAYQIARNLFNIAYQDALTVRGLVHDSEGLPASELDSDKNYVLTIYIDAIESAIDEAALAIDDPKVTINKMNAIANKLRKASKDIRENYFKGEK